MRDSYGENGEIRSVYFHGGIAQGVGNVQYIVVCLGNLLFLANVSHVCLDVVHFATWALGRQVLFEKNGGWYRSRLNFYS